MNVFEYYKLPVFVRTLARSSIIFKTVNKLQLSIPLLHVNHFIYNGLLSKITANLVLPMDASIRFKIGVEISSTKKKILFHNGNEMFLVLSMNGWMNDNTQLKFYIQV